MALVFFNIWELKLSSSSVHVCYQTLEPDTYNECLLVQPRFETTILVSSRGHFSGFSLFKIFTRLHETEAKPIFSFFTNYFFQIVFSFENSMYKGSRPRFCCKWHQCGLTLFLPGEGGISPLIVCHVTKSVRNRVNLYAPVKTQILNDN